jgi:predicted aconitase
MDLTKDDEKMLKSDDYITRICMESIAKYGEAAGAERLVDRDGNGVIPTMGGSTRIPELGIDIAGPEMAGERLKVFTISRNLGVHGGWEDIGIPPVNDPEDHKDRGGMMKPWMRIGVHAINSCAYYLTQTYLPTAGEYCSWHESSAIPWGNAIPGAKSILI